MSEKIRVGLVYGGKSGEHDVSLQTALAVINAFDLSRYEIIPFYISRQGEWRKGAEIAGPVEHAEALLFDAAPASAMPPGGRGSLLSALPGRRNGTGLPSSDLSELESAIDVVFPLLHGTYGEDGTIQGLLEMANLPYVGAGVLSSAVGMDKVMMKKVFAQEELPQCLYRHFTRSGWRRDSAFHLMEIEVSLGYPCFVKPANLGSSVGISKVKNRKQLLDAIDLAFQYDRKVIIEEAVEAREIEVGVLGNDEPRASVPGEIVSSNDFYDYKAKYISGTSMMIIPAELSAQQVSQLQEMAGRAFAAIDAGGLARVDFFLRKSDGKIMINEINTMPGFTPHSMYPLLWKESGLSYGELLDELIRLALEKYEEKQGIHYGFDVE